MRRATLLVLAPVLLTSCSGGTSASAPGGAPQPSNTCPVGATTVPDRCVPEPTASPTVFPGDPTKVAPVSLSKVPGLLGSVTNEQTATRRTGTFSVTVPKGSRIGSIVSCLGNGTVTLDTTPRSDAFQQITCNADGTVPSELQAESAKVAAVATRYTVTVTASAASRWAAGVYATTAPVS